MGSLLALDLGTTTGWALQHEGGQIISGTVNLKPGRYDGGGMRYLRFRHWLDEMSHIGHCTVLFEEVRRHVGTDAAHVYGGFLATLSSWCEEEGWPYQGIPVGTIKRAATGRGNATKEQVLSAVRSRGFVPTDSNEADALAMILFVGLA